MSKKPASSPRSPSNDTPSKVQLPSKAILGIRVWIWGMLAIVVGLGGLLLWSRGQQQHRIKELREQFQAARETGDWVLCEQTAVKWGLLDPLSSEPIISAAVAAKNQKAMDRVVGYLMQLPTDAPVEALIDLSRLQFEALDDPMAALETTQRIAKRMPSNREAHLQLLYFWAMTRQSAKLIDEAKRGIQDGACTLETFAYLFEGDRVRFADELVTNRRWAQAWPDVESFQVAAVLAMVREAEKLESKGGESEFDPIELRKKLNEDLDLLSELFPTNPEVIAFRTQREMNNGNADAVRKLLKKAPAEFEQDHRFWRVQGWLLDTEQKPTEALKEYTRSLAMNPFDMQNYFERAGIYRQLGHVSQMESDTKLGVLAKELHDMFRDAESVFSLPPSYYDKLLSFFEQTQMTESAHKIRSLLKQRRSEIAVQPQ
jgi:tetratricopeptide (TPR) repeat protein